MIYVFFFINKGKANGRVIDELFDFKSCNSMKEIDYRLDQPTCNMDSFTTL